MGIDPAADDVEIAVIAADDPRFDQVVHLAAGVVRQDRALLEDMPGVLESVVVAAFADCCVGFLRFVVQVIGQDEGRPPVLHDGAALREGYVEAFGVEPSRRRRGIGTRMQTFAADYCRTAGCYQIRSRSPMSSTENYALKIEAGGYTLHPSNENDSYYFCRVLRD